MKNYYAIVLYKSIKFLGASATAINSSIIWQSLHLVSSLYSSEGYLLTIEAILVTISKLIFLNNPAGSAPAITGAFITAGSYIL